MGTPIKPTKIRAIENLTAVVDNSTRRIIINVSGVRFITTLKTLQRFPHTVLGQLLNQVDDRQGSGEEIFFDADDDVFREVLRYHRTGELHTPTNMCQQVFNKQLEYWGINADDINDCCQDTDMSESELEKQFLRFEKRIEPAGDVLTVQEHVWYFLTDPQGPYTRYWKAATGFTFIYMILTLAQALNLSIHSLPIISGMASVVNKTPSEVFAEAYRQPCVVLKNDVGNKGLSEIWIIQETLFLFFLLEIIVRVISCPNKRKLWPSVHLLDMFIASVEFVGCGLVRALFMVKYLPQNERVCLGINIYILVMLLIIQLRCTRLLAFATVFSQLRVLMLALWNSKKDIALLISTIVITCLVCGPCIYFLEVGGGLIPNSRSGNLVSVPDSYWWVVVTMTTVGYGDYYPTTLPGYIFASLLMIEALMLTALPVAIIGGNYAVLYEHNQKREKRKAREHQRKKKKAVKSNQSLNGSVTHDSTYSADNGSVIKVEEVDADTHV